MAKIPPFYIKNSDPQVMDELWVKNKTTNEYEEISQGGGGEAVTWTNIVGKPAIVAAGDTQVAARASIGAGTGNSNLALGTTATTALAGNTVIPPAYVLPAAGSAIGGVKRGIAVANATDATDVITQLNALLTSLKTAGVIA